MGAMFEADLFFFFGIFYSAFVCLFAMSAFLWLELQGWLWFSDFFVIAWIACSMTGLAWMKVWMVWDSFSPIPPTHLYSGKSSIQYGLQYDGNHYLRRVRSLRWSNVSSY